MRLDLPPELEPLRSKIEASIEPCIVLSPAEGDARDVRTRFGGTPLLAPGVEWPSSDRGPLSFVGQIDFRELRSHVGDGLALPTDGILSFFYDVEEQPWGYDPAHASGWRLLWAPDSARTVDAEPPPGAIPFDEEPLAPSDARSLPFPGDITLDEWEPHHEQAPWLRAYQRFVEQFTLSESPRGAVGPYRQQVGGHPQWLAKDGRLTAELASNGVHAGGDPRSWRRSDLGRAEDGARSFRLLWQLKPEDDRFTWVDLGTLYVLIREEDLRARRFDRAWVVFQSG